MKTALIIAAFALTSFVGVKPVDAGTHSNSYMCAYGKRFASLGRITIALSVSPRAVGPTACRSFNHGWHGRRVALGGLGHIYCAFGKEQSGLTMVAAVFAPRRLTGRAMCRLWHPRGFVRIR